MARKDSRKGHARDRRPESKARRPGEVTTLDMVGREILRLFGVEAPLPRPDNEDKEDEDEEDEDEDEDG